MQDTRFLKHDFELSSVERPKGTNLPGDSPDADLPGGPLLSELKLPVGTTSASALRVICAETARMPTAQQWITV
jgi:hypothetical protein